MRDAKQSREADRVVILVTFRAGAIDHQGIS
jgi:hypothetical protein